MNSKLKYIAIVAGVMLLSLFAIVPAFGAGTVEFIDPGEIEISDNNVVTVDDRTPDEQEWARQGGMVGIFVEDDDSDFPIRRVLIPIVDGDTIEGVTYATEDTEDADLMETATDPDLGVFSAHGDVITFTYSSDPASVATDYVDHDDDTDTDAIPSLTPTVPNDIFVKGNLRVRVIDDTNVFLDKGDYLLIGEHTVRKVTNISTDVTQDVDVDNNDTNTETTVTKTSIFTAEVTVDRPFSEDVMPGVGMEVRVLNSDVLDEDDDWADNYHMYAVAKEVTARDDLGSGIADSGVAISVPDTDVVTVADRMSTSTDRRITKSDVLVVETTGNRAAGTQASDADSRGVLGNPVTGWVVYWSVEPNEVEATVRTRAQSDRQTLMLRETGNDTGEFAIKIEAVDPTTVTTEAVEDDPDTDENESEAAITLGDVNDDEPLTLLVNPDDVITVRASDDTASLKVETTSPVFSGLEPGHNSTGRDEQPDVSGQVTDGDSGLDEDNIKVVMRVVDKDDSDNTGSWTYTPSDDDEIDDISGGFEFQQRLDIDDATLDGEEDGDEVTFGGDVEIEWWVVATDDAGNLAYSDRQPTKDGESNPCKADGMTEMTEADELAGMDCQPYVILVDATAPSLVGAETGRHWDTSLDTSDTSGDFDTDSDDKTEYRANKGSVESVLVIYNEHIDASTVSASDYEVDGDTPNSVEVRNVTVRQDDDTKAEPKYDGNSKVKGDDVTDPGQKRGYVFLSVDEIDPDDEPEVDQIGDISDLAGNRLSDPDDVDATDRVAPTLTVMIVGGDRPVTNDEIMVTITSDEGIGTPKVTYHLVQAYMVDGDDETTTNKVEKEYEKQDIHLGHNANVVFKSDTEYEATMKPGTEGLYTVFVEATDAAGAGNMNTAGDKTALVDVSSDTSAILFEVDESAPVPTIDPNDADADTFKTDDPNGYLRLDFSSEGSEYTVDSSSDEGIDVDTHGMVTLVSVTLGGEDITDQMSSDSGGTVFLYRVQNLAIAEHDVEVVAEDEAGNRNETAVELTFEVTETDPFELELNPGWNLVSIPGEPRDSGVNVVIPADHPIDSIRSYDPSVPGAWLSAVRGADGMFEGTLDAITSSRAYWVHTQSFESLDVDIPRLTAGAPVLPPEVAIVTGWNMIPVQDVTNSGEGRSAAAYTSGLDVTRIYTFNTVQNAWESLTVGATKDDPEDDSDDPKQVPDDVLEIGRGYWIFSEKEGTLAP